MNQKQENLAEYLEEKVDDGKIFFKSKFMADELDMSPKEIGANMGKLADSHDNLAIEKWSYSSATTWKVEKKRKQVP
ncbi:MAG: hypothetical protein SV377_00715 [Halobacteria archaeon]|nr:hypothetical protein [Halobacteria archaeon]